MVLSDPMKPGLTYRAPRPGLEKSRRQKGETAAHAAVLDPVLDA